MIYQRKLLGALLASCVTVSSCAAPSANAAPSVVRVVKKGAGFQLTRGGKPYFIKGAGGDASKVLLRDLGGNSFRTWGADGIDDKLEEAQKLGLTVTVGMWLGHKEQGFKYDDPAQVQAQFESAKRAIMKYKDNPAVLAWGIGNEMEGYDKGDDPLVWKAVQDIAAFAHKVDPNHPTMTVIAEIGGDKVPSINKWCPDIDIIGINSYGGAPSLAERYPKAGGVKPYVVTEYGPPGTWEGGKTSWGAAPELTSTQKADYYRSIYEKTIANQPLSLGGYAFAWGNKQEATATWFGLMLPDGSRLAATDTLGELWSGKAPRNRVPVIQPLQLQGKDSVQPGATVKATLVAVDPEKDPIKVDWVVQHDPISNNTNGATEAVPPTFPDSIVRSDSKSIEVKMPDVKGGYRIFAYVHDNKGGAAVANLPLFVESGKDVTMLVPKGKLPFAVYDEAGNESPYAPSGYMGNAGAIKMTADDTTKPHSGKTAIKAQYTASDNWAGVVWQSPANDWGAVPGGRDLTGARKLSFWARGEKGGETVSFSFGLIGKDQKYPDSGKGELKDVKLTTDWKQYSIDLKDVDLSQIKTGFSWIVGAKGEPITFYLDDIKYE